MHDGLMDAEDLSRLSTDMLVLYVLVLITFPTQMHGSWLTGRGTISGLGEGNTHETAEELCKHIPCSGTEADGRTGCATDDKLKLDTDEHWV